MAGEDFISLKPTFIGGAERARRNARKRQHQPRSDWTSNKNKRRHHHRNEAIPPYPKSMREYERFFGSLLSSSTDALQKSETDGSLHQQVMHQACSLLNVPALPTPSHLLQQSRPPEPSSSERNNNTTRTHNHQLMKRSSSLLSNASSYSTSTTSSSSSSVGTFDNARSYYTSKSSLILEESRCIIAESLSKTSNKKSGCSFALELTSIEEKYPKLANGRQRQYSSLILNFNIVNESTPKRHPQNNNESNANWKRPGSVLLLSQKQRGDDGSEELSSVLACVVPNGNWQSTSSTSFLSLMIFRREDLDLSSLSVEDDMNCKENDGKLIFCATALTTLISQVRQMEACLRQVKVSFMRKLLGQKNATHIRFDNGSSDDEEEEEEVVGDLDDDDDDTNTNNNLQEGFYVDEDSSLDDGEEDENDSDDGSCLSGLLAKIPKLNETQERAAKSFLDSPKESLVLVQGPPGTGKSTFLVNVICRRLANHPNSRLLVTAPTNKAVTVLAERFMNVVNSGGDDDLLACKCNAVLVGVEDKLISHTSKNEAEYLSSESLSSSLRDIFVYTWIDSLKGKCHSILSCLKSLHGDKMQTSNTNGQCETTTTDELILRAERVKTKLSMSIPSARSACSYAKMMLEELRAMAAAELWEEDSMMSNNLEYSASALQLEKAIDHMNNLIETLNDMESSSIPELLATARVIFCTLSTAGSSILKQTRRIDDLLIDEAAAASEPEICIPFHLRPQRMLAVGDPLQLPPTIMSRHAADMGLNTSLHERLMHQCDGTDYVMLDRQYRMHMQISNFPCNQFYNGKIKNGKNVLCKTYTSSISLSNMKPYSFINIRGQEYQMNGGSYANEAECIAVVGLVQKIAARRVSGWESSDKLRIITFYQGQVTLLRRLLAKKGLGKVLVATVDSSQGCEADVVIISFVRSSSKKGVRHATGFLADDRRINVALTRAKHQLICVGDSFTLGSQGSETLRNLVSDAKQRRCLGA